MINQEPELLNYGNAYFKNDNPLQEEKTIITKVSSQQK